MTTASRFRVFTLLCFLVAGFAYAAPAVDRAGQPRLEIPPGKWHPVHVSVLMGYFDASKNEVETAANRLETADEMTAAFLLARVSGKSLTSVLRRRAKGMSWSEMHADLVRQNAAPTPERRFKVEPGLSDEEFERRAAVRVTSEYFETAPHLVLTALRHGQSILDVQKAFRSMGRGHEKAWVYSLPAPAPRVESPAAPVARPAPTLRRHAAAGRPDSE